MRGSCHTVADADDKVVVCAWFDGKRALPIGNYQSAEPMNRCKRWDKVEHKTIEVPRPAWVTTYIMFMGGVDKADMLLAFYKTKCRTRK